MSAPDTDSTVEHILRTYDTITVVGASNAGHKAAHCLPEHMQAHGWRIISVNPTAIHPGHRQAGGRGRPALRGEPLLIVEQRRLRIDAPTS